MLQVLSKLLQVLSKLSSRVYSDIELICFLLFEHFRNEQILTIAKKHWNFYFMANSLLWKLSTQIGNLNTSIAKVS